MSVVMANLNFNRMQVNDKVTVEALLSTWPLTPPELERSAAALENTNFRTMLEVGTKHVAEMWVWLVM